MNIPRPVRASEYELPTAGDVVSGKYRIVSTIGTGGMGVVLGAIDTSLGRKVAIKFLAPQKADREGAMARFGREARAAASIQSEYVARVFEVGALPNGASYIVMEQLVGADLAQTLVTRGAIPMEEAIDYVLQACEAIGEAHARGIVHRDLKPQNLFLARMPNGTTCVKILDFGISKAVDDDEAIVTFVDMVMGTPMYMSPEQMRSLKLVDRRSDIWALGAILFELLTGSPIFDAETTTELCAMIMMEAPTPLRRLLPEAPVELEAAILRCLHKDPNGRFQDVAGLAEALAPFASERGRISASNVSCVVRTGAHHEEVPSAPPPANALSPFNTTSDVNDVTKLMMFVPAAAPISSFPPVAVPTTQQTWAPGSSRPNAPARTPRSASAPVVALGIVAGLLAGVAGLALMGGGYFVYSKKIAERAAAQRAVADAAATAAPPIDPKDAELAAEKRVLQNQCTHMQSLLRTNDTKTNKQVKQVRSFTCLRASGSLGTTCDRATCRSACTVLDDKACLQQLDQAERSFPARF